MKSNQNNFSFLVVSKFILILFFLVFIMNCNKTTTTSISTKIAQDQDSLTIVHKLLADELHYRFECNGEDGSTWFKESIKTLDNFLSSAKIKLETFKVKDWQKANKQEVESALKSIDQVLHELGYVVCVKTQYISTTLGQPVSLQNENSYRINLNVNDEDPCYLIRTPGYRDDAIRKNWREGLRPFDCDLGAILYIAIAEQNSIPLTFVEVPNHNFVRWHFADGSYLNWDTNDAQIYSDNDYRIAKPRTTSTRFSKEQEELNKYLVDMSIEEIQGYFAGLLIGQVKSGSCIEELYERSARHINYNATALNNFAWAFATKKYFENTKYGSIAVKLAKQATYLDPNCNFWDTFSCAYAANNNFTAAIKVEKENISTNSPRIPRFLNQENCYITSVADEGGCN